MLYKAIIVLQKMHNSFKEIHLKYELEIGKVKCANIVKAENIGEKLFCFKKETTEKIELQDIYEFCSNGSFEVKCPKIDVWEFKSALCFSDTDFIIVDNKAYWQKYYAYNYAKNIVRDKFLVKELNGAIYYYKPKVVHNVKCAFSLIGVFANIWSHSLSEHYIKLSVLDKVIAKAPERLTILVPDYEDAQLKQIVYKEIEKYNVDVLVVKKGEAVYADILYYMERPAFFTDHEVAVEVGDNVQPQIVADTLKEMLVKPALAGIRESESIKLYLPRRGLYRSLQNNDEVEAYFKKQGFYFLEPHKVTLEEKIKIFHSASIIVGPYSSAFSNIIFCKPGTKVLIMSNYYRAFESWLVMHKQNFNLKMLWVTGYDDKTASNPAHCCFRIPLEKIKGACGSLGV